VSERYAFLWSARWLGLAVAVLAFVAACVVLGMWQWDRFDNRLAEARQVADAYDAEPVPLTEVTGEDLRVAAADEWRPARVTGHYVDGGTVLLRNRPVDGSPAVHAVTPFVADTGVGQVVVVVDRGWLPAEEAEETGAVVPQPPTAGVAMTGRLRPAETAVERDRPTGQIYRLAPDEVIEAASEVTDVGALEDLPVLDGYLVAAGPEISPPGAEDTAASEGSAELGTYPRPSSNWGLNLSYAFQWWLFAAGGLVAVVVLARREAADRAGDAPRPRRVTAEEEEDALVDAQLEDAAER